MGTYDQVKFSGNYRQGTGSPTVVLKQMSGSGSQTSLINLGTT